MQIPAQIPAHIPAQEPNAFQRFPQAFTHAPAPTQAPAPAHLSNWHIEMRRKEQLVLMLIAIFFSVICAYSMYKRSYYAIPRNCKVTAYVHDKIIVQFNCGGLTFNSTYSIQLPYVYDGKELSYEQGWDVLMCMASIPALICIAMILA